MGNIVPPKRNLNLREAEETFLRNNLALLSSKFEIESKKGEVLQAGLWDNPTLSLDQNIYNKITKKYFDTTKNGETSFQLQQLFVLAGKRDKRIRLAQWNREIAEQTFYDTLRGLKLELRTSFFQLYYARKSLDFFDESVSSLKKTVSSAEIVHANRNILLSELLRLRSILFRLETDRLEVAKIVREKEAVLKVLLNEPSISEREILPEFLANEESGRSVSVLEPEELLKLALESRPDLRSLELAIKAEQTNLSLQKAMRIPDVALGGSYDRAGNYVQDYYGVTVSVPLPVFDRNQGNIRSSEMNLNAKKASYEEQILKVSAEVRAALGTAKDKEDLVRRYGTPFTEDYRKLAGLMTENYKKKYITILEFSDFFEAYSDSMLKMIRLQSERVETLEALNYAIGKTVAEIGR
ncbi:TolC family protein [Leptospira fluminis]|uniref:TolC family protein n=2 Tax=Leptospira fluminis TaxID=2484979 RepID=A0A4R9GM35_9LEPT|nr:TolC family protein [Leptospira fluminis]